MDTKLELLIKLATLLEVELHIAREVAQIKKQIKLMEDK